MRIIGDLVLAGFGQLKNARIENVASDPSSPQNGQLWYNTTDQAYRGFNGSAVVTFATGGNTQLIIDALTAETSARIAGDQAQADALTAETSARVAGDQTVQNNIDAETSARVAADTAETDARVAEDGSIRVAFAAADTAAASATATAIAAEASARVAADDLKVAKAGDSMTGNLAFGGLGTVTGVTAPVNASDVTTKNYVDSLVSGLSWKMAVTSVSNGVPTVGAAGDRILDLVGGKIYTATATDTFDAGVGAVDGDAVFSRDGEVGYVFSGTSWTQFTGTGMTVAGIGLSKTGNQIDVNLGAGIAQLPSDEVGIDVRATGGVFLTEDGTTPSTGTNAQLAIRLDGDSLTLGEQGVKVSNAITSQLDAATLAISVETSDRIAALAAETSARIAGDTAGSDAVVAETSARIAGDNLLQGNINTESSARVAAIAGLTDALAVETSARTTADSLAADNLVAEASARVAGDQTAQNNIDAEASARVAADTAEASARTAADAALSTRINGGYFLYDGSTSAVSHLVEHNIGTKYCQVLVVDSNDKVVIPDAITFIDANSLIVDFISAITCKVVVSAIKA